jgi:hypothetical protein
MPSKHWNAMEYGVVAGLHSAASGGVTPSVPADMIRFHNP